MPEYIKTTWEKLGLEAWNDDLGWMVITDLDDDRDWYRLPHSPQAGHTLSIARLRYVERDGLDEALSLLLRVYPAIIPASHREGAGLDTAVARELLKELGTVLGKHYGDAGIQGGPVCAGLDVPRLPANIAAYSYNTHTENNQREHAAALRDIQWLNELTSLTKENNELRVELIGLLTDLIQLTSCQYAVGDYVGWWDTRHRPSARAAGERLVELGAWERHPQGQWYRPKREGRLMDRKKRTK